MPGASYQLSRSTITVRPHSKATVRVRLRIDRSALRKVADPTIEKLNLDLPRQFLADESGRVVFTPTSGSDYSLRVAVYAAPKPTANIKLPSSLRIRGATGTAFLGLTGRGLNQGTGDARYLSLYSALELQAKSPKLQSCNATRTTNCALNNTARGGDLRYVGVASTAPAAVAAGSPGDAMIGFGIATWKNWANIGVNTTPFVDIDTTGDGMPDFETFVLRSLDTDLLEAWTVDLASGDIVDIEPVNLTYGDIDSNTFDTNVILLPVFLEALGIDPISRQRPADLPGRRRRLLSRAGGQSRRRHPGGPELRPAQARPLGRGCRHVAGLRRPARDRTQHPQGRGGAGARPRRQPPRPELPQQDRRQGQDRQDQELAPTAVATGDRTTPIDAPGR